jgi:hypothetical protein
MDIPGDNESRLLLLEEGLTVKGMYLLFVSFS